MTTRCLAVALLFTAAVSAQIVYDPLQFRPELKRVLDDPSGSPKVQCDIYPIKPTLNFSFRYQAGYVAQVPLKQYRGAGHAWALITKITPEAGEPVYLVTAMTLPPVPETKQYGQSGGGYLLGEGRYSVEWTLFDDSRRVCRKSWKINVARTGAERKLAPSLPPGTVAEMSLRGSKFVRPGLDDVRPVRLTILLHAAPLFQRRTRLRTGDALILLSGLSSLLERLPAKSVRLVAFNLDQQKEVYRQEGFTLDLLDKVAQSLNQLELGAVDYRALQKRAPAEFLAGVMDREVEAEDPSEIVIVLGPPSRYTGQLAIGNSEQQRGMAPFFFHFQFQQLLRQASASYPDLIEHAMGKLKGKTIVIRSAGDFAKAIDRLENYIAGR